jgi:WXG100 family type VII secretion target
MADQTFGNIPGIASDASSLQDVSDEQASIMHKLASIMDSLVPTLQGDAGVAMQQAGERLHNTGTQIGTMFADHSQKMSHNAAVMDAADQENAHLLSGISQL